MTKRLTKADFISRSNLAHDYKYDYHLVEFKNTLSDVEIICPVHGSFWQAAHRHLEGKGCKLCAFEYRAKLKISKARVVFVERAMKAHAGKGYSYFRTQYEHNTKNVIVTCPLHGDFEVRAHNHLHGDGCQICTPPRGYSKNKPGHLYIASETEGMTKIGISNKNVLERLQAISASVGRDFELVQDFYLEDGCIPRYLEATLLKELREMYWQPSTRFSGSRECFYAVNHEALISRIEELIQEHTDAQNNQAAQAA